MPLPVGDVTVVVPIFTEPLVSVRSRPGPLLFVEVALASVMFTSALLVAIEAPPVALIVPPAVVTPASCTMRPVPLVVATVTWPRFTVVASTLLFWRTMPSAAAPVAVETFVTGEENMRSGEFLITRPSPCESVTVRLDATLKVPATVSRSTPLLGLPVLVTVLKLMLASMMFVIETAGAPVTVTELLPVTLITLSLIA